MVHENKKGVGFWVIIGICVFLFIMYLATGLITIFKIEIITKMPGFENTSQVAGSAISKGIFVSLLGCVFLAIAIGFLLKKKLARASLIVLCAIQIIFDILLITRKEYTSIINLVIYLMLGLYLIFGKRIKRNFQ